jgi:diguanylate cyclase (GGDEF)-like protein
MTKWLQPSITAKLLLLLFGFLALQLLQLGIGVYSMRRIEQHGMLANAIQQARLHSLELGNHTRKVINNTPDTGALAGALGLEMVRYGQGLLQIETLLAWHHRGDPELNSLAQQAGRAWDEYLYPMLQQARIETAPVIARDLLERYQALSAAQVERLNRMLLVLEQREREVARRLALAQAFIVALSVFLVAIGAFMMRHMVTHPLRQFFEVTRAMADGAYDRRVEVNSTDEIGELARAFNRMAGAVDDKTDRLRAMNEVALAVTSSLSLHEILDQIMRYGMPLAGARAVCIAFYDEVTKSFSERVARGLSQAYLNAVATAPDDIAAEVIRRRDYVASNDKPGGAVPLSAAARAEQIHSIVCLPLASNQHALGVIYFYRGEGEDFGFEDIELIRTFSHLAAHAIQNARLHELTVDMAETDVLTGLYNRRKLEQRLRDEIQRAQRSRQPLALLLLDIDHFKKINDNHGHAGGDAVLMALAGIFRREIRDVDLVARTGGEEFMFLLPDTDGNRARLVAERIREALAAGMIAVPDGARIQITASVGVAGYPLDAGSAEALIANADRALYTAKQGGRNRVDVYAESLLH